MPIHYSAGTCTSTHHRHTHYLIQTIPSRGPHKFHTYRYSMQIAATTLRCTSATSQCDNALSRGSACSDHALTEMGHGRRKQHNNEAKNACAPRRHPAAEEGGDTGARQEMCGGDVGKGPHPAMARRTPRSVSLTSFFNRNCGGRKGGRA